MAKDGSSLAPALDTSQASMTSHLNVTSAITSYCHALLNTTLRPATSPPEDWFTQFSSRLAVAQQHGQNWITNLGPAISSQVPQTIIDYGDTFSAATGDILGILQASGNNPSPDQVKQIHQLIGALLTELGAQKKTILDLQGQLRTFASDLISDHKNLLDGANDAQKEIGADEAMVAEIKSQINLVQVQIQQDSQAALESQVGLGIAIFVTIVAIAIAVGTGGAAAPLVAMGIGVLGVGGAIAGTIIFSEKVKQDIAKLHKLQSQLSDEQAQVTALDAITTSVEGLASQNEAAQRALSSVLELWQTLEDKLQAVITDLEKADKDKFVPILQALDIQTAQTQWAQLVDFATKMQQAAATVSVGDPIPYPPPASQAA